MVRCSPLCVRQLDLRARIPHDCRRRDRCSQEEEDLRPGRAFNDLMAYAPGRVYAARGGITDTERSLSSAEYRRHSHHRRAVKPEVELDRVHYLSDGGQLAF